MSAKGGRWLLEISPGGAADEKVRAINVCFERNRLFRNDFCVTGRM